MWAKRCRGYNTDFFPVNIFYPAALDGLGRRINRHLA